MTRPRSTNPRRGPGRPGCRLLFRARAEPPGAHRLGTRPRPGGVRALTATDAEVVDGRAAPTFNSVRTPAAPAGTRGHTAGRVGSPHRCAGARHPGGSKTDVERTPSRAASAVLSSRTPR